MVVVPLAVAVVVLVGVGLVVPLAPAFVDGLLGFGTSVVCSR
jgi:hypothetical protein